MVVFLLVFFWVLHANLKNELQLMLHLNLPGVEKGLWWEWFGLQHHIENQIPFLVSWCFWGGIFSFCKQIWFCFWILFIIISNFIGKKILWESLGILIIWKSSNGLGGWSCLTLKSQAQAGTSVKGPFLLVFGIQLMLHSTLLDSAWALTVSGLVGDEEVSMAFRTSSFDSSHCSTEPASFWTSCILLRTAWRLSWCSRSTPPSFSYFKFTSDMSHWISVRSSITETGIRLGVALQVSFWAPHAKLLIRIRRLSYSSQWTRDSVPAKLHKSSYLHIQSKRAFINLLLDFDIRCSDVQRKC